jgi:hypothetical protein
MRHKGPGPANAAGREPSEGEEYVSFSMPAPPRPAGVQHLLWYQSQTYPDHPNRSSFQGSPRMWYPQRSQKPAMSRSSSSTEATHLALFQA